jgi:hypothetical protein
VKESDLDGYEKNAREKQKVQVYKIKHQLPFKSSHKDVKHRFPPQISKARSIEGFDENISQLSLCIDISHLNISLLNVISQEVVSPHKVSHSFMEDWIFYYRDNTSVITHEGNSLKDHSKVSHGVHNPQYMGAAATYSASMVD